MKLEASKMELPVITIRRPHPPSADLLQAGRPSSEVQISRVFAGLASAQPRRLCSSSMTAVPSETINTANKRAPSWTGLFINGVFFSPLIPSAGAGLKQTSFAPALWAAPSLPYRPRVRTFVTVVTLVVALAPARRNTMAAKGPVQGGGLATLAQTSVMLAADHALSDTHILQHRNLQCRGFAGRTRRLAVVSDPSRFIRVTHGMNL